MYVLWVFNCPSLVICFRSFIYLVLVLNMRSPSSYFFKTCFLLTWNFEAFLSINCVCIVSKLFFPSRMGILYNCIDMSPPSNILFLVFKHYNVPGLIFFFLVFLSRLIQFALSLQCRIFRPQQIAKFIYFLNSDVKFKAVNFRRLFNWRPYTQSSSGGVHCSFHNKVNFKNKKY